MQGTECHVAHQTVSHCHCGDHNILYAFRNNACLRSGTITEEDLDALVDSRELPGKVFDLDYQCQLAFGLNSVACIGPNETSVITLTLNILFHPLLESFPFLYPCKTPLTYAEACEKSSRWLRKEKLC